MLEILSKQLNIPSILYFKEIDSTNRYCMKNINKLTDKQVVISEIQTDGYGRYGRKWISSTGKNIFLSLVLKDFIMQNDFKSISSITHLAAVVICEILEDYGVYAKIKWPNDVLVNGKKIAGILSQSVVQGNKIVGLVVGMGINLNIPKTILQNIDKPATSLNVLLKKSVNNNFFLENLVKLFINRHNIFKKTGFASIKKEYIKRCNFLGKKIKLSNNNNCIEGQAVNITNDGELVMEIDNNQKIIVSGEIL